MKTTLSSGSGEDKAQGSRVAMNGHVVTAAPDRSLCEHCEGHDRLWDAVKLPQAEQRHIHLRIRDALISKVKARSA